MLSRLICVLFALAIAASLIYADQVTPSNRVTNYVTVRDGPSTSTDKRGELHVGETAQLIESVPSWYKVRLADGTVGFVSKSWTVLIPDAATASPFKVHFLDVGTGDSAIIDIGNTEIVIDGGDSVAVLNNPTDSDRSVSQRWA